MLIALACFAIVGLAIVAPTPVLALTMLAAPLLYAVAFGLAVGLVFGSADRALKAIPVRVKK